MNSAACQQRRLRNAVVWWCALCAATASAQCAEIETRIGMEGVALIRYHGRLETKAVDEHGPLVLRIAGAAESGGATSYELRYVGLLAGTYDLREFVQRVDGRPATDLTPLPVTITEVLPTNHDGSLDAVAPPALPWLLPLRRMLWAATVLWLVPLGWLVVRWFVKRAPARSEPENAEPSLADQLRPLVETAVAGELSVAGKARLELLLIAHWRQQLKLSDCTIGEVLRRLRGNTHAGRLLRLLDQWLHERPGRSPVDVAAILEPYRRSRPIDADETRVEGAVV